MNPIESVSQSCPWCSETITFQIDTTISDQEYIEDCSVCCSPIVVQIRVAHSGDPEVELHRENE